MRTAVLMLVAASAAAALTGLPTAGHADPYRWCAVYTGKGGGARNCGFVTLEQCRQTIMGMGGFCEENPFYSGPVRRSTGTRGR